MEALVPFVQNVNQNNKKADEQKMSFQRPINSFFSTAIRRNRSARFFLEQEIEHYKTGHDD